MRTYKPTGRPVGRPVELTADDVATILRERGPFTSLRRLEVALGRSHGAVSRAVGELANAGRVTLVPGPRGSVGVSLVEPSNCG